ncbi:type II toxin-antitoxin system Phd/YefM family antitoxin [Candidatus Peregrinibacteria bacterium]|nr:type II toxin-antitoxin system Phd/YefM family antitoxin [Candidatus Peregrinibacteria bacterium]
MSTIFPKTASSQDIQRNYRTLFNDVKNTGEPLFVSNNGKLEIVVISLETFKSLSKSQEEYEQEMARKAIENYQLEEKNGKLKKLSSLADLM